MNWFLKILLNNAITMLEKVVTEYVKNTPDAWDDALAAQLFAFLKAFVNGTQEQQKMAFESLKSATTPTASPPA
jgi:hypothetical protein